MTLREGSGAALRANAILAGSVDAIRAALKTSADWATPGLSITAAAIVGRGDIDGLAVAARAPAWDALEFTGATADILILAEAAPSRTAARALLTHAAEVGLRVMLLEGRVLRALRIDDVIGRALGEVDWSRIRALIAGRRVMITGGGGSIGGELARRIAAMGPGRLCVLDSCELNLFKIGHELPDAVMALADVRDAETVRRWVMRERPQLIFHAAALKHVPIVEAHPSEGVLTNVWGCRNVADAAGEVGADMVFVSTDKAVDPTGVMGATKRLAEMYCQALDRANAERNGPRVLPVRLGNVLGSSGSVTPLFEAQLAAGGPLTVTDAHVTRYFTTIPQAADFLLLAAALNVGAEAARGAAFVLDMGEPLAVVDLARKIIRLTGQRPDIDVPISFVGLRPGEKLHEALVAAEEWREADPAPGMMAAASAPQPLLGLADRIEKLVQLARAGDDEAVAAQLRLAVAPAATETLTRSRAS
jgi:FlaA1/EpsC-like NDP-sugar epimerase